MAELEKTEKRTFTFEELEERAESGRQMLLILAALDLGLFDLLDTTQYLSLEEIAESIEGSTARLAPLLDSLCVLGFLERALEVRAYRQTENSKALLSKAHLSE